ncbi:class I SAM-dependent methyltransferase [Nocardioides sp. SYSU D00038]|uniref:class I SAM-dependent methyltransferase n=1 Tax=Nocardioides sp. SYSU D00038 TaxID=2812554 RepID=UPI001967ECB1|nr:class I SAM-dependent methyltransferase [Nocardioides sp. SYSU D00038]
MPESSPAGVESPDFSPAAHYDKVTDAWGLLLGDNLHYGVFEDPAEDLGPATDRLTSMMIERAQLASGLRVLDVGCGTGAPACRLVEDHDVEVLGITTSAVGVAAATARAAERGLPGATFEQRDGTANGLPDASFDRAWVMESSHLMTDRQGLLDECSRVLRPGGRIVLCDIIRRREIPFLELRDRRREFAILRAAYGAARMDTLEQYTAYATSAGLSDVQVLDVTAESLPTFDKWQANLDEHRDEVLAQLGQEGVEEFEESLDILRNFWVDGTLGYGLVWATKP